MQKNVEIDKPFIIIPEPFRRDVKGRKREWVFWRGAASLPTTWGVSGSTGLGLGLGLGLGPGHQVILHAPASFSCNSIRKVDTLSICVTKILAKHT